MLSHRNAFSQYIHKFSVQIQAAEAVRKRINNIYSHIKEIVDKCKKEFLDSKQSERLEELWIIEKLLKEDLITLKRNMNFDGKTFFFRFPTEFTKKWSKGGHVDIKLLTPEKYLIEVKA